MFESDDFDQVLSQFEFPEIVSTPELKENVFTNTKTPAKRVTDNKIDLRTAISSTNSYKCSDSELNVSDNTAQKDDMSVVSSTVLKINMVTSPKHTKRKIINSHFDHKVKRKFPGPAGILTGSLEETKDENISHIELLSQDIEYSQNSCRKGLFESPLWLRLQEDVKSWNINHLDPITSIKQQALAGNLRRRKAQTVAAFVETVDRSATDPLVILRDLTGTIKCTLHRDAWSTFSPYIVSDCCALVLWKPTILTTGSAFKKHYLNITLSNIYAIYSSAILENDILPGEYAILCKEDFTVIKSAIVPESLGSNSVPGNESLNEASELLDGLDDVFSDLF